MTVQRQTQGHTRGRTNSKIRGWSPIQSNRKVAFRPGSEPARRGYARSCPAAAQWTNLRSEILLNRTHHVQGGPPEDAHHGGGVTPVRTWLAYQGLPALCYHQECVQHSAGEYVRARAHTNGMKSFWSLLKRGYIGVYHKMSPKHLGRYVAEFRGRHNIRRSDTCRQMARVGEGMAGKRLRCHILTADNGLPSGARS